MIRVSVFYPNSAGATFDMAYYTSKHLPMVQQKAAGCRGVAADTGVAGRTPGSQPTYIAIGYLLFDSVASFESGFAPHAAEILGDIPNFTNTRPLIQFNEIKL
jgi:uncharacterized protein (TIGR02118 family)